MAPKRKMETTAKKFKEVKRFNMTAQLLNEQLGKLKSIGAIKINGKIVAPMDHAPVEVEGDLRPHDDDGPDIEVIELEDDYSDYSDGCSILSDPPQLQRSSSTESLASQVSVSTEEILWPTSEQLEDFVELPSATELSKFMESRVNFILGNDALHVYVREIHCEPILFNPPTELQHFLEQFIPREINYKERSLMCFQRTATGCVMFFYLSVQEYDKSCPPPYQNTAYIAMLDSVRHLEPSCERKKVYNCILLSYLQYLRHGGFKNAFLWACPPMLEEEYVFNQRPTSQKTPTEDMLVDWYTFLMETGVRAGVLKRYSTLYDWCPKTAKEFFSTFPYYYGDHWVDKMDETVKSLENLTCTDNNEVIMTPVKKKPPPSKGKTARVAIDKHEYVFKRVLDQLKVYKKSFFCMELNDNVVPKELSEIVIPNGFGGSRDKILNFQKKYSYSMSDLRHAEYTTHNFLIRLYMSSAHGTCGICEKTFTNGVRCKVCDQNVCESCNGSNLLHDHNSWMKIVSWKENGNSTKANSDDKDPKNRHRFSSKYDTTNWHDFLNGYKKGNYDYDRKFLALVAHIQGCEKKRVCGLCKGMFEYFFKRKLPSMPLASSSSSTLSSSSDSTCNDNAKEEKGNAKCDTETPRQEVQASESLSNVDIGNILFRIKLPWKARNPIHSWLIYKFLECLKTQAQII